MTNVTVRYSNRPAACFENVDDWAFKDYLLQLFWYCGKERVQLKREVLIPYRHVIDIDVRHDGKGL